MSTLLLDRTTWDLVIDSSGNIAVADDPYAVAQNVSCALKVLKGELFYDTAQGTDYLGVVLGKPLKPATLKAALVRAALTVPGVVSAVCYLGALQGRTASGQVTVTTTAGVQLNVGF